MVYPAWYSEGQLIVTKYQNPRARTHDIRTTNLAIGQGIEKLPPGSDLRCSKNKNKAIVVLLTLGMIIQVQGILYAQAVASPSWQVAK